MGRNQDGSQAVKPEDVTMEEQCEAFKLWKLGSFDVEYWSRSECLWKALSVTYTIPNSLVLRRKREPKLRPWTIDEVPVQARFKIGGDNGWSRLLGVTGDYLEFSRNERVVTISLLEASKIWCHSMDGKTYLPCGVVE